MDLATVALLGLAAYRATRIFTTDTITEPARARLYRWAWIDPGDGTEPVPWANWRTYAYELVTCPFCLGVWASAVVYGLWRTGSDVWRGLVVVLAVAGVQSFVSSRNDA